MLRHPNQYAIVTSFFFFLVWFLRSQGLLVFVLDIAWGGSHSFCSVYLFTENASEMSLRQASSCVPLSRAWPAVPRKGSYDHMQRSPIGDIWGGQRTRSTDGEISPRIFVAWKNSLPQSVTTPFLELSFILQKLILQFLCFSQCRKYLLCFCFFFVFF